MNAAVIVAWRPKGFPTFADRPSARAQGIPQTLLYDRTLPPFSGIQVASLLPSNWKIELIHEAVRDIDFEMDIDIAFISTMDFAASHTRAICRKLRSRGVKVIVGGLYPSVNPSYFRDDADSVVVGEAESTIKHLISDIERNQLAKVYQAKNLVSPEHFPSPRYELVETDFSIPMSYEATRGCPFRCSFCILSALPVPHRLRPIDMVLSDIQRAPTSWSWIQRHYVSFLDNNIGANRAYFRELCQGLIGLKKYWGASTSIDTITPESARLMGKSRCRVMFIGLESLSPSSLKAMNKRHNKIREYREKIRLLHANGVLVMSIFLVGMDGDTPEYLDRLLSMIEDLGVDLPVFSLIAPIEGTPFRQKLEAEGRMLAGDINDLSDGVHLVYQPQGLAEDEVEALAFSLMRDAYTPWKITRRIFRGAGRTGPMSLAVSTFSNLFYRSYQRALAETGETRLAKRGSWQATLGHSLRQDHDAST